jgi:hypothetical protein
MKCILPKSDSILLAVSYIGSFQKRSTLPPRWKFLLSGGGGEKKLFLIIVNACIRTSEGGRLTFNFLRGGGMDVFWNDPFTFRK